MSSELRPNPDLQQASQAAPDRAATQPPTDLSKPLPKGRLVWNHSTHIPGLIALLNDLLEHLEIRTITPGVLRHGRAHAPKLILKVSVPIRGGYKLIARQGKSVQEVFILTQGSQEHLEAAIAAQLAKR